jgi:hypothetical protein
MIQRKWTKALALAMLALVGVILAPGCDLGFGEGAGGAACDTSGAGGAGGAFPSAGCTPSLSCGEMYSSCQDMGYPCNRKIEPGKTLCGICNLDCAAKRPYTYTECYKCGFRDP